MPIASRTGSQVKTALGGPSGQGRKKGYTLDDYDLSQGELEILIDGLTDDVAFVWVMIHLGIRTNPPAPDWVPSSSDIAKVFLSLKKLVEGGLVKLGHLEYVDRGPPSRLAPVNHVPDDLEICLKNLLDAVKSARNETDWAYSCWAVNTEQGDAVARQALEGLK